MFVYFEFYDHFFLLLLALLLGSFFNVVALRIPKGESIAFPPSYCPCCKVRLGVWDLIPVFSYLFLLGRCRRCKARISFLYPLGELLTGLTFTWLYLEFGFGPEFYIGLLLASLSIIIVISDLKYMLIPNKVLLYFLPLIIIARLFYHPEPIWNYALASLVGGGLLFLIAILSRGGMGMGDVKLFFVYGLVLGFPLILLSFFLASLFGGLMSGILLLFKVVKRKQPIPFGPFLALGTLVSYVYGEKLLDWYFSFMIG